MKHIKLFEHFLNFNTGDVHSIFIHVNYENIPGNLKYKFSSWGNFQMDKNNPLYYRSFQYRDVVAYSENKEELEYILASKKFNI